MQSQFGLPRFLRRTLFSLFLTWPLLVSCTGCEPGPGGADASADADVQGDTAPEVDGDAYADAGVTYACDDSLLEKTVSASPWVRETTDIRWYRYLADREEDRIQLEPLDAERESLGILTLENYFERIEGRAGTIDTLFDRSGAEPLQLASSVEVTGEDAYRVENTLTRGDQKLRVHATFRVRACYHGAKPDAGWGHPCSWPVPVGEPQFALPSCGFDLAPGLQSAPNLTRLTYSAPVRSVPAVGGVLWSDELFGVLRAFDGGERVEASEIDQWSGNVGVGDILGTRSEELLSAAYADPAWIDHVERHARACADVDLLRTAEQPLGGCMSSQLGEWSSGELRTQRQGLGGSCGNDAAASNGDPHLTTYDGSGYDFQGAGEFVMARARTGNPFEIQARMQPFSSCRQNLTLCANVTVNTAVATKIGQTRIGVYAGQSPSIYVDGRAVENVGELDLASLLPRGASLEQTGPRSLTITWPDGAILEVAENSAGTALDLTAELPHSRRGQVDGLWGTYNRDASDDFRTRNGTRLTKPLTFEERYRVYGESWRVRSESSLFDYEAGENTRTFSDRQFPDQPVSFDELPPNLEEEARKACEGADGEPARQWCMLDVVCMCSDAAADPHEETIPVEEHSGENELVARGDVCLTEPASLAYSAAPAPDPDSCTEPRDRCVALFVEADAVDLGDALQVDATEAGQYRARGDLPGGEIAAGTQVRSHLLHLDEVEPAAGVLHGGARFSADILGIAVTGESLDATDGEFGRADASYPQDRSDRGLDWARGDRVEIGSDLRSVSVRMQSREGLDQIRVFTRVE